MTTVRYYITTWPSERLAHLFLLAFCICGHFRDARSDLFHCNALYSSLNHLFKLLKLYCTPGAVPVALERSNSPLGVQIRALRGVLED